MTTRSTMTPLITHLRTYGEASETDVFNGVTYWTDEQLQDVLDKSMRKVEVQIQRLGRYDNVSYALLLGMPYWIERSFSIYVSGTTTEETTPYTYNDFTKQLTFDSNVLDRNYIAYGNVVIMTDAIAELWNLKAQHRKDYIVFKAGSHRMEAEQVYKHCLAQRDYWNNLRVRSFKSGQRGRYVQ